METAKREMAEDICTTRTLKVSSDAMLALAHATSERTTVAFFTSAEMRDTPEAIAFRKMHARKLMAAAGMDLSASPPSITSEPSGTAAAPHADTGSSTAAAAVSEGHAPPSSGNKPAAGRDDVHLPPPTSASTPAATATHVVGATANRGARSRSTKQTKAAAALAAASTTLLDGDVIIVRKLKPARAVADESDSEDDENA